MSKSGGSSPCDAFQLVATRSCGSASSRRWPSIGLIRTLAPAAAPVEPAEVDEGALGGRTLRSICSAERRMARRPDPEIEGLHRERDRQERNHRDQQSGDRQQLVAERGLGRRAPACSAPTAPRFSGASTARTDSGGSTTRTLGGTEAAGTAAARLGWWRPAGSGACANDAPAAISARAMPTHAQTTRNMLQSPEPPPNAALFV